MTENKGNVRMFEVKKRGGSRCRRELYVEGFPSWWL